MSGADASKRVAVGVDIPIVERTPDEVDLFTFSASAWLLHRIHYDRPFTTDHDGHPGLLIHGPLQGTYLIQCVQRWLGATARLRSIEYRHSSPAYVGDVLRCGGKVTSIDDMATTFTADLWVKKRGAVDAAGSAGEDIVTTSGTAMFTLVG